MSVWFVTVGASLRIVFQHLQPVIQVIDQHRDGFSILLSDSLVVCYIFGQRHAGPPNLLFDSCVADIGGNATRNNYNDHIVETVQRSAITVWGIVETNAKRLPKNTVLAIFCGIGSTMCPLSSISGRAVRQHRVAIQCMPRNGGNAGFRSDSVVTFPKDRT